jgi:hypothetical protein
MYDVFLFLVLFLQVCALALSHSTSVLATAQEAPHPEIRLWDFTSQQCLQLMFVGGMMWPNLADE